ncbi:hypothetical protein [Oligoflexus tunisiensis]|uniref:hypothetical protein n=1 Tax=Oligoflexus tunisiensis TaxID=708132 RepID=UPI00114CBB5B|nr:hypothetical protein [Oligoflexus tunisiensis]
MNLAYVKSLSTLLKQPIGAGIQPQLVDIQSPLYRPQYFGELIRGMARRHRPRLRKKVPAATAQVRFSELDRHDWHQFIAQTQDHIQAPLTYYNSAGAFCLFRILGALRINFSTILHLQSNYELTAPLETVKPDSVYTMKMELSDVVPRKNQCILIMRTELADENGRVVRVHKDFWFVKKCPPHFLEGIASDQVELAERFRGLSKRMSSWQTWDGNTVKRQHRLGAQAGLDYGRISGDHNIIHTTTWGARLCGQKRPFLQGFGVMNLTLHYATQVKGSPAESISITFARPALVDQVLDFHFNGNAFEICDERQRLVAFGQYS